MNGILPGHKLVQVTKAEGYKGYGDRLVSRDVTAYCCECGEVGVGGNDWTEARISFLEHTVQLISIRLGETVNKPPRDIDPVVAEAELQLAAVIAEEAAKERRAVTDMLELLRESGPLKINVALSRMKAAGHSLEHISGAFITMTVAHRIELSHNHYLSITRGGE